MLIAIKFKTNKQQQKHKQNQTKQTSNPPQYEGLSNGFSITLSESPNKIVKLYSKERIRSQHNTTVIIINTSRNSLTLTRLYLLAAGLSLEN